MDRKSQDFLYELLRTPSPSGSEQRLQHAIESHAKRFADVIEPDLHGNLLLGVNTSAKRRVLLAAHCDQIAFMVSSISDQGLITFEPLGGADEGVLPGTNVVIHSEQGAVPGVLARKVSHLQSKEEMNKVPLLSQMWIDIGAIDEHDARERVKPGDCISFRLEVTELANRFISAPGLDNKAGLFVALEALRCCSLQDLDVGLYVASTVQEEIGLRGAQTVGFKLAPEVALAIDVTLATDDPSAPPKSVPCRMGKGPTISSGPNTNPHIGRLLRAAAERKDIPFQPAPTAKLEGNDAKNLQVVRGGVATASIGIPNRNMHTPVEVCSLQDIENTILLVCEFVKSLRHDTELRPFYGEAKETND
jgi:tetrahedral aminopeptidase